MTITEAPASERTEARWVRPLVIAAAALSLLLIGAATGLMIGLPGSSRPVVPAFDSVDVGFLQDMSVHHQQAVEMASVERGRTTDPRLLTLASDIEHTQNSQFGRMQGWLELWDAPLLPLGGYMGWMSGDTGHAGMSGSGPVARMPGMATSEELAALRAATGPQMDVLFMQLMLRHHEGGASMLEYAAQRAEVPQVRNLASQMLKSQSSEIEYLRQLLAERGAQPLPL